jgi:diguanylate cyclase (GGDEF)-like protein
MKRLLRSDLFLATFWRGWRYWTAWLACVAAIVALGIFRAATDAEFALASLVLLPVLFISWVGRRNDGIVMALLAAAMWAGADIASSRQFDPPWIPMANAIMRLVTYALVALLAAQVRLKFEQEHESATRDVLTGLYNRRAFLDAGIAEVERSKRYGHSLTIVFLDLDDFKQLNDTKGHDAGDAALRASATAVSTTLRSSDLAARLGGDEFAVLLPEIGFEAAVDTGRKISIAVHQALKNFSPVTVSVGLAYFDQVDQPFDAMLKSADQLMYEVKQNGKSDVRARRFPERSNNGSSVAGHLFNKRYSE